MYLELSAILHILEKMKNDIKKRGIPSKKFEEGYESAKRFKRHLKELKSTLDNAQNVSLNNMQTVGRALIDINIHLISFISYIVNIQALAQLFLENKKFVCEMSYDQIVLEENNEITKSLEDILDIFKKINEDLHGECISNTDFLEGKNKLRGLKNEIAQLTTMLEETKSILSYTSVSVMSTVYIINKHLSNIVEKFKNVQQILLKVRDTYLNLFNSNAYHA